MNFTPSQRVCGLGAVMLVALTICSRHFSNRGGPYFMITLAVAAVAYLFAVREFFINSKFPRHVLVIGLAFCALWQMAFLRLSPGNNDDIHRYVWDGRLQRLGYNPYLVIPSNPAVQTLHTATTRTLNNPDLPSPYPPGAQLFFRAVTAIHESVFAMKVTLVFCAWAIVFLLLDLARLTEKGAHLVLVYAWNPLLAIEVAGSGHIDIVGALFLVTSAVALARRWRAVAAAALALSIAVKFLPLVLLPMYWKRIRIRDAVLGVIILAILYMPFLDHGRIPIGSIGAYVQGFRFNGPIFAALDHLLPPAVLVGLALLVGLAIATVLSRAKSIPLTDSFAWPMAASLFFAPAIFPWYLLWLLPFLTSSSTLLIVIWTVSILLTYIQWHLSKVSGAWGALPAWVMLLEYGCLACAAVFVVIRRTRLPAQSSLPTGREQ